MRTYLFILLLVSQAASAEPLFYFHVGTAWTYEVEGSTTSTVTNTVSEVRTVNGKNWYKLVEYGETFWVGNTERGQVEAVNFFDGNPEQLDEPEEVLIFKYPATVGETWNNAGSPTTYKGKQTITVPAGIFDCHVYFIDMGLGYYSKSCIANNVGVVYNEAILENGVKEISKLIKYDQ